MIITQDEVGAGWSSAVVSDDAARDEALPVSNPLHVEIFLLDLQPGRGEVHQQCVSGWADTIPHHRGGADRSESLFS